MSSDTSAGAPVTASTASNVSGYGVVQSVETVTREQNQIGAGTAAGAVVGGLLGNQIGSGSGRTAATIAGAAGGAYAGHQMEKNSRGATQAYRVTVRMDNGALQTLEQNTPLSVGQRVRLANGVIVERLHS